MTDTIKGINSTNGDNIHAQFRTAVVLGREGEFEFRGVGAFPIPSS